MKQFELERDIEKTPTIFGLRAVFFFIFVGVALLLVPLTIMIFTFDWLGLLLIIFMMFLLGAVYAALYYYSQSFQANKLADEKMPDVISNNP
jgi:drug/metabolite transporter (DMT)-like permease